MVTCFITLVKEILPHLTILLFAFAKQQLILIIPYGIVVLQISRLPVEKVSFMVDITLNLFTLQYFKFYLTNTFKLDVHSAILLFFLKL